LQSSENLSCVNALSPNVNALSIFIEKLNIKPAGQNPFTPPHHTRPRRTTSRNLSKSAKAQQKKSSKNTSWRKKNTTPRETKNTTRKSWLPPRPPPVALEETLLTANGRRHPACDS
jgi:hypothetical protein